MHKRHFHLGSVAVRSAFAATALLSISSIALAQRGLPAVVKGPQGSAYFGHGVASGGDGDGDGFHDILVTDKYCRENNITAGRCIMISGRDGGEVWRSNGASPPAGNPNYIKPAFVGDIDGDAHADFAIGGWNSSGRGVAVISGRTGEVIHDLPRPDPADNNFGWSIAGGKDIDGDRVPDFITSGNNGFGQGRVYLFSGATGNVTGVMTKDSNAQVFGIALSIADVTGDGQPEVAVGDHQAHMVFDLPSARLLHWSPPPVVESGVHYGTEHALGDVNGDGFADFLAGRNVGMGYDILDAGAPMLRSPVSFTSTFRRGRVMEPQVSGAAAGRVIQLLATRHGSTCTYIGRLQICIDLARPFITVAEAVADIEGTASFSLPISPETPTGSAWLQALDPADPQRGAITSNVLEILIAP